MDHNQNSSIKFIQNYTKENSVMARKKKSSTSNSQTVPKNIGLSSNSQVPGNDSQAHLWDKLICPHCKKQFQRRYKLKYHVERVHKLKMPENPFTCIYCDAKYLKKKWLETHYEEKHQIKANASVVNESKDSPVPQPDKESKDSPAPQPDKGRIRCIDCSIKFTSLKRLRRHLRIEHQLDMTERKISFPNFNAFRKWKLDIERRESTYFYNYHGPFKGTNYLQRIYICHRSGPQVVNVCEGRRRMNNLLGTRKTGISCTATMKVNIYQNEVQVEYCLQHYGHGSEMTFVQLTIEEQAAVLENAATGIPIQEQLVDIKHAKSLADHFKAWIIKKRDSRFFDGAYASEIYNAGMGPLEYVNHWVNLCSQMEECPILLYKQEALGTKAEDFTLIIMSEFQKNILLISSKQVVCLDTFSHSVKGRCFFTVLVVMDEQDIAFPVAFCISKKMDKSTILQFFSSIKKCTGPLSCTYFMSNDDKIYYETWQQVMQDKSTWIWSIWSFEDNVRKSMHSLLKDIPTRDAAYRYLRTIMECTSQPVFATMLKNFKKSLLDNKLSKQFGKSFELYFGSNEEMWACCYRKDLKLSTNIYLEFLHKTLRYCFKMCNKQRLDKFVMALMKWLRVKMLDCLSNILDEEKIELAKATISTYHNMSLDIDLGGIFSVSDQTWLVQSENELDAYVTREYDSCPELCDLRCSDCDVCVHMYSCTCVQSLIQANMCEHIHAVVCKFITPQFSEPISPVQPTFDDTCDIPVDAEFPQNGSMNLRESALKSVQAAYVLFLRNKCKLNNNSLTEVMGLANKCYRICAADEIPPNFYSKSTQTETIPLLSSNQNSSYLSSNVPNSVSKNNENSSFTSVIPYNLNAGNDSSSTNHEDCNSIPVSSTMNTVINSASEKNKNITSTPVRSNNVSESDIKGIFIPTVPSDFSEANHPSKRRCVEKTNAPSFPLSTDSVINTLNTVINSASEKNENITSMPVGANNVSESGVKGIFISTVPSDFSEANHPSERHCVEKTNAPSFPLSTNSSNINSITNLSTVTKTAVSSPNHLSPGFANTQLNLASETSSVAESSLVALNTESSSLCSDANAARNSLSNSAIVSDPLLSERPYLIKCNAPIIRIPKSRAKNSTHNKNSSVKQTTLSSTLTTNNSYEAPRFFYDPVSKRYFSTTNKTLLTPAVNHFSDIILKSTSELTAVSPSNEHSEPDSSIVKSSVPHDSSEVKTPTASTFISNQHQKNILPSSVIIKISPAYHDPIMVKACSETSSPV